MKHLAVGIDVGGSGIKGAAVDASSGELMTQRLKVHTPQGGRVEDIARIVGEMTTRIRTVLNEHGHDVSRLPVGVTLPGAVKRGVMWTAANLDEEWIGTHASRLLAHTTGTSCTVVNDADAAGIAEVRHGAIQDVRGTSLVLTFGTGIGSACISDGHLVPNFELGHLELDGHPDIEQVTSARAITREGITMTEWARRAERYLTHLEMLMHPDRFVLGGGISRDAALYLPFRTVSVPVIPAHFKNNAGIVGVACLADEDSR